MAYHHIHLRKRSNWQQSTVDMEPYPHAKTGVRRLDHMVMFMVGLTPLAHIPQLIKIYTERVAALSLLTWALYFALCIPWLVYGVVHRERLITYTYVFNIVMYTGIIAGIVMYG